MIKKYVVQMVNILICYKLNVLQIIVDVMNNNMINVLNVKLIFI